MPEYFSRNILLYKKEIDELNISLPTINGKPNYETMSIIISAVKKMVIQNVVQYADKKIIVTKEIVNNKM